MLAEIRAEMLKQEQYPAEMAMICSMYALIVAMTKERDPDSVRDGRYMWDAYKSILKEIFKRE